jgi:hypothetical protein
MTLKRIRRVRINIHVVSMNKSGQIYASVGSSLGKASKILHLFEAGKLAAPVI